MELEAEAVVGFEATAGFAAFDFDGLVPFAAPLAAETFEAGFATTVDLATAVDFAYFRVLLVDLALVVFAAVVLEAVCAIAHALMAANVAARTATRLEIGCARKRSV